MNGSRRGFASDATARFGRECGHTLGSIGPVS